MRPVSSQCCLERDRLLGDLFDAASRQLEITRNILELASGPEQKLASRELQTRQAAADVQAAWDAFNKHTFEHGCKLREASLKN
jgi:hypothetical protein